MVLSILMIFWPFCLWCLHLPSHFGCQQLPFRKHSAIFNPWSMDGVGFITLSPHKHTFPSCKSLPIIRAHGFAVMIGSRQACDPICLKKGNSGIFAWTTEKRSTLFAWMTGLKDNTDLQCQRSLLEERCPKRVTLHREKQLIFVDGGKTEIQFRSFSPMRPISNSDLQNHRNVNLCCFKPQGWWSFI